MGKRGIQSPQVQVCPPEEIEVELMSDEAVQPRGDVHLRAATVGDTDFLAWGLNEAAGGLFVTMLGKRALDILGSVISEPAHEFSFEHAVVAMKAGSPVGFCQGMPYGTPRGTDALMRVAGIRSIRAIAVVLFGRPVFSALERHSPGEWYLQAIAVHSQARGLGVGQLLFADAFRRASVACCRTLALDVDAANSRARALYERLGLQVVYSSGKAVLLDGAQIHRMTAPVPKC